MPKSSSAPTPSGGDLGRLGDQLGDREALDPRHRLDLLAHPLAGDDEGGLDQLRRRERRSRGPGRAGPRSAAGGACGCREGHRVDSREGPGSVAPMDAGTAQSRSRRGAGQAVRRAGGAAGRRPRGRAPGELVAVIGPTGPARRRCSRSSPGSSSPTRGEVELPRRRGRLGAAAGGALPAADRRGEPAALRAARGARGPARLGRGDARAVRARRAARRDRRPALGRQPAAGQHRDRAALAAGRCCCSTSPASASTRASGRGSGSSSAASPGGGTTVIFSTHDIQEAERYGRRLLVLADGEASSTARPRSCARRSAARRPEAADRDFETAFVAFLHHRGH